MKNPLIKRLPRELKGEIGKYIVLFLFITMMIGIVSGFLVAAGSMSVAYDESFEKYNIESGNFELLQKADDDAIKKIEDGEEKIKVYENFYLDEETKEVDSTVRIFKNRKDIDKICVMEGELPTTDDEIAIDRMYAVNNDYKVGDNITLGDKKLKITGYVALSDYSALYSNPSDTMFDSVKFGVAIVTDSLFDEFGETNLHYSYSWKYDKAPVDDKDAQDKAEELMKHINSISPLTQFIPEYSNQAIHFTGDDIKGDSTMIAVFLYLFMVIIAFIFAITTGNTIAKEANVIGTLRASGYTKAELVRHYLATPMFVVLVAAVVGNILGYTCFKDFAVSAYYGSYSLPTYVTLWNAEAFVKTTVVPLIILFVINLVMLINKLSLSPLKFLRRDLKKHQKKKAFKLNTKIGILKRFRLRIIFQNIPNYVTIFVGVLFASVIIFFGLAMKPMLLHYQEVIEDNMIAKYQYVLKAPIETETKGAEKYCAGSMKTVDDKLKEENVTVYGIQKDSKFVKADITDDGVYISDGYSQKFGIDVGDELTMKESYGDKKYTFKVDGVYDEPAAIAVYMTDNNFIKTFDLDDGYFNGYFSNTKIKDIDDLYIATTITKDDMTKTSRQLIVSMGSMISAFAGAGIISFMLIIYLLSKVVIEKNSQSISMTKILGYNNREINSLYITTTSIVVIVSLILSVPLVNVTLKYIFIAAFAQYSGWLPYYIPAYIFVEVPLFGIIAYAVVAFILTRRVKKVPLDEALKNVE